MSADDNSNTGYASETIYGTHEDSHVVMSEKVQSLAGSIYQEFERMIAKYDEDVVKTLMPLLVNVLECLDSSYQTNQEHEVELELLREDNEQLVTQYEREKAARKHSEQKLLESEDHYEGDRKELTGRLESLDSVMRMLELKHKNSLDHSSRLEERENELKKEYAKLHDRYTELFKTHMDYMERSKLLLSPAGDRGELRGRLGLNPIGRSAFVAGPNSYGYTSLEVSVVEQSESVSGSPLGSSGLPSPPSPTIGSELAAAALKNQLPADSIKRSSQTTSPVVHTGKSETKSERRSGNTLYQELSFQDNETNILDNEETADVTGSWVHPGEYASSVNDNYFGMGKEVENLILENNELLATKNALNVVKDDLIVKVDELTGEQEILREEVAAMSASRDKLRDTVYRLEDELRKLRETVAAGATGGSNEEEADVPMAQRKRFTRVEMARVLMERNQYKERFMELQEAVRWTEMVRARRVDSTMDKKSKQSIWKFFSNLFSTGANAGVGGERPQRPLSVPQLRAALPPAPTNDMKHSRTQPDFLETQLSAQHVPLAHARRHDRSDHFRQVRAHVRKDDGRTQAYGWSLPAGRGSSGRAPSIQPGAVPVPVPVFCRPIAETWPRMQLMCAAAASELKKTKAVTLADEMNDVAEPRNTSLVWICSSTETHGVVMILDANNPAEIITSFNVPDKHILCVAAIPALQDSAVSSVAPASPPEPLSPTQEAEPQPETPQFISPKSYFESVAVDTSVDISDLENNEKTEADNVVVGSTKLVEAQPVTPSCDFVSGSPPLSSSPVEGAPIPKAQECEEELNVDQARVLATMWLGTKSGHLYVHSAVSDHEKCIGSVKLRDAVLAIASCGGKVSVGLADGTLAMFGRSANGSWDLSQYWLMLLGSPTCSVRCVAAVEVMDTVWCGYRNIVHIVCPCSRTLLHSFPAHPRRESQVRQLAALGDGVWLSIKMDSTLRLYHAKNYQHLRDVDIEPYVSKMLGTGKLGFSFVRITALLVSDARLWIGTSNGVVISVPLSEGSSRDSVGSSSRAAISLEPSTGMIPWCSMAHAQLSFHGHRDAVSFFVAVPASSSNSVPGSPTRAHSPPPAPTLVISGGEGYIDFRIADGEMEESVVVAEEERSLTADRASRSHLIVWQVSMAPA